MFGSGPLRGGLSQFVVRFHEYVPPDIMVIFLTATHRGNWWADGATGFSVSCSFPVNEVSKSVTEGTKLEEIQNHKNFLIVSSEQGKCQEKTEAEVKSMGASS